MDAPEPKGRILTPEEAAIERDLLAMKLRAEFGMMDGASDENVPPELELAFLEQVYAFEKGYTGMEASKTYKETLQMPDFAPWPEDPITWEAGEKLVEDVLGWYRDKLIEVVFEYEYPAALRYAFLTAELPALPNHYGRMPLMQMVISYEDYFPNHGADIERQTENFMEYFFSRNAEGFQEILWREQISPTTGPYDGMLLLEYLGNWFAGISGFEKQEFHILETSYELTEYDDGKESSGNEQDDDTEYHGMGYAEGLVGYVANSLLQSEPIRVAGPFKLYFEYREGNWGIVYPQFPGLPIPPEG